MTKVLIAEDDIVIQELMYSICKRQGFEVEVADNGLQALNLISHSPHSYGIIITDSNMPFFSGAELIHEVFKLNNSIKVVVCSGEIDLQNFSEESRTMICAILPKPFSISIMSGIMTAVMSS